MTRPDCVKVTLIVGRIAATFDVPRTLAADSPLREGMDRQVLEAFRTCYNQNERGDDDAG